MRYKINKARNKSEMNADETRDGKQRAELRCIS